MTTCQTLEERAHCVACSPALTPEERAEARYQLALEVARWNDIQGSWDDE